MSSHTQNLSHTNRSSICLAGYDYIQAGAYFITLCTQTPGAKLWQRNCYERIIRDEPELNATRLYIDTNPTRWDEDKDNPARLSLHLQFQ